MTAVETTDLQITNENYKEVGQAIANLMKKAFGSGSFAWNFSKGHYNKYGCEQSYMMKLPKLEFITIGWGLNTIHYDGQWYKGYYRKRGVSLFNFRLKAKEGVVIPTDRVEDYIKELRQAADFIEGLAKIETSVSPLTPLEAGWDEFPQNNNFVEFRGV